jgi:hypothetical protein
MKKTMSEVKAGKETTEYEVTKKANFWAVVGIVIGTVLSVGSAVADAVGADSKIGVVVGGVVTVVAFVQKWLVSAGYIKSRTAVKQAAAEDK